MKINQELYKRFLNEQVCVVYPVRNEQPNSKEMFLQLTGYKYNNHHLRYFFFEKGWFNAHPYAPNGIKLIPLSDFFIEDSTSMIEELFPSPNKKTLQQRVNEVMGGNRLNSNDFVIYAVDKDNVPYVVGINGLNSTFKLCPLIPCNKEFPDVDFVAMLLKQMFIA